MSKGRRIGRLPKWQRNATHLVLAICALSGVVFLLKQSVGLWGGRDGAHDVLIIHGVSAAFALMAFGAVLPAHIRISWIAKRNITSGLSMLAVMGALMLTGLLLYYGAEESRDFAELTHEVIGFAAIAVFPLHILIGKFASG